MGYAESIRDVRSKFLLKKGEAIWYHWYDYPNGARWIVKYKGRYYLIIHDGTGNQFYCSHAPTEISEERAKRILSDYPDAWEEAQELWGWEDLDEYLEKEFEKRGRKKEEEDED